MVTRASTIESVDHASSRTRGAARDERPTSRESSYRYKLEWMMTSHRTVGLMVFAAAVGQLALVAACSGSEEVVAKSESHKIVEAMIKAHGGLEAWRSAPTISFECSFLPAGAPSPLVSREVIEQGPRRAYIDYPGSEMRLAWDGKRAWSEKWNAPYPPRLMALMNYYFLNLPWLTMDPGVVLGDPETGRLWDDPKDYITIKMAFEPGVGDTPDDYYVLYVNPTTQQLKACKFVVTYAGMLPEGAESTPEHIFVYDEFKTIDGLTVPTRGNIYKLDQTLYASTEIRDWSFSKPFDGSRMIMPKGAIVDASKH